MLTIALGLTSAFVSGAADFLGGIAAKRMNAMHVTAAAAVTGFLLLAIAHLILGGEISAAAVGWGALSGISAAAAIALLYGCLAIGPMSILSPITAVISAAVPMFAGLLEGERLQPIGYAALGLAIIAIVLVGLVPEKRVVRPSLKGLLMAAGSGLAIGMLLILLDKTPPESGLVPLVANRAANALTIGTVILGVFLLSRVRARRSAPVEQFVVVGADAATGSAEAHILRDDPHAEGEPATAVTPVHSSFWRGPVFFAILAGSLDATANIALLEGIRLGDLTVMSVLNALYPGGTIILAAALLRERMAPVQAVGLVLAISAAALLALA